MSLHRHLVGRAWATGPLRWTFADTALYALGVGAGADDPAREREFTTENSAGVTPAVLPTFATTLVPPGERPALGDFDVTRLLHSHQSLTLHGPLPVEGAAVTESRLTALHDRGSAALAVIDSRCADAATGRPLADLRTGLTIRHEGGFGGEPGEDEPWRRPEREPDHTVGYRTAPHQALLYRLCGDRNPLHSDPAVAARIGLLRPPLHGLCTFGFAGRALLHALCGGDPARFGTVSAAFTAPVLPGRDLTVRIWETAGGALFEVRSHGRVVLGRGRFAPRGG
ncbi:MaoC/PaaZ C-terminal domain-containing protein [Streptomyces huiliensis]|uniref:MaoC/PaaZ C-terminal domain-containing protein n=1 Tax=Streptomyces huiliensis TaxID=2876027 RepID=UPI001CBBBA05|nr:MaoC/PaaZ C-terminal domain-containing protein [Streptomyces huiliensis]MBZ4323952.1 3-alpha,7-alpha,12-alpha-trihydroxy-5-beta-cholest-24-enoyl-CoA hydratase [Streptomyces huiliensis]